MAKAPDVVDKGLKPRYVSGVLTHRFDFTFATLVADDQRYQRLVNSLQANGFDSENTELIALDNRNENNFDGYTCLRRSLAEAQGRYIVVTHDDVELLNDGFDDLKRNLDELTGLDAGWAIAGNAGGTARGRIARHISDPIGDSSIAAPERVESLDENFIIVRRERIVLHSLDLTGFHFYGSDLCLQAETQGVGGAYVIPFKLRHHSRGRLDESYYRSRGQFSAKYSRIFPHRRFSTTVGTLYIGGPTPLQRGHLFAEQVRKIAMRVVRRFKRAVTQ